MIKTLTIIGTRPEAIKLAPILMVLKKRKHFDSRVCITKQHTDLLDPLLVQLGILVDYELKDVPNNFSLSEIAAHVLSQLAQILTAATPDLVIVQGDTTSAFIASLAAFYASVPIAHIEAGLRTQNLCSPWPEEAHRCLIDKLATYFFAPTQRAKDALINEGVAENKIWVVGNTSIDAIRLKYTCFTRIVRPADKLIIVTIHRRENQGKRLQNICYAIYNIANLYPDIRIALFLHPNPFIRKPIMEQLSNIKNIDLLDPMDHFSFIQLVDRCSFIITDSGGLQEEASFIGKPLLITRDTTERPEGVQMGVARLVGTKASDITNACIDLLENPEILIRMSKKHYSYGDGYAAERIVQVIETEFSLIGAK